MFSLAVPSLFFLFSAFTAEIVLFVTHVYTIHSSSGTGMCMLCGDEAREVIRRAIAVPLKVLFRGSGTYDAMRMTLAIIDPSTLLYCSAMISDVANECINMKSFGAQTIHAYMWETWSFLDLMLLSCLIDGETEMEPPFAESYEELCMAVLPHEQFKLAFAQAFTRQYEPLMDAYIRL